MRGQQAANREQSPWGFFKPLRIALFSLLIALLSACTGSSEDPLPALLAVGMNRLEGNNPNTAVPRYEIRFYPSNPLQPGNSGGGLPQTIPAWNIAEPLVALLYRRDSSGDEQLWVLTERSLRRYQASFTFNEQGEPQVGNPSDAGREQFNQPLQTAAGAVGCRGGYIRSGVTNLLIVCPPQNSQDLPLIPPTVWRIPFNAANAALPTPLNLNGFLGELPLRLALARDRRNQDDQLLYLTPRRIGIGADLSEALNLPSSLTNSNTPPSDLLLSSGVALGLMAPPISGGTLFFSWNLDPNTPPSARVLEPNVSNRLSGQRFSVGLTPVFVLGQSFARFDNNLTFPPDTLSTGSNFGAGLVASDQFLYLTTGQNLNVVDLQIPTNQLTNSGIQQNFLNIQPIGGTNPPPTLPALAFIPTAGASP